MIFKIIYHIPYTIYHIPYFIYHIPCVIYHIPFFIHHTSYIEWASALVPPTPPIWGADIYFYIYIYRPGAPVSLFWWKGCILGWLHVSMSKYAPLCKIRPFQFWDLCPFDWIHILDYWNNTDNPRMPNHPQRKVPTSIWGMSYLRNRLITILEHFEGFWERANGSLECP